MRNSTLQILFSWLPIISPATKSLLFTDFSAASDDQPNFDQ